MEPGGPAIARTVQADGVAVEVRKLSVGPMDNNAYLLTETSSGRALLVDAANDAERILAEIGDRALVGIVTTHGHDDHWQALAAVADATGAPLCHHPADADRIPLPPTTQADHGMRIAVGDAVVTLLHTPGHTPGSVCVLLDGLASEGGDEAPTRHLLTGDTLFPGGPGNTFGDVEAFRTIMRSLRERIFPLGDRTWVYPGHGDDTTLGAERPSLDEWDARGW